MVILIRFGEIALKSRYVRRQFVDALVQNIHEAFAAAGQECVTTKGEGRVYLRATDEAAAVRVLRRVFGIVSVSRAVETEADVEAICRDGAEMARPLLSKDVTFAVRARRSGSHAFTSQDVAVALGRAIQDAVPGAAVDLSHPEVEVHVEVRGPVAYLFTEKVPGPGGMPLGTQGRAVAWIETPRDAVAAWMMMRRGCRVTVASSEGEAGPAGALKAWAPGLEVVEAAAGDLASLGERVKAEALISGADVPRVEAGSGPLPVFHPTVGLSDGRVKEFWERIRSEGEAHEEP